MLKLRLEVTDTQSVNDAAATIAKEFGRLDIVINNAGVMGGRKSISDSDPDVWWQASTCTVFPVFHTVILIESQ